MHITLKGDSVMKKNISKIYLGIIIILYNVFSYIYATDGLKIQLATKIQNNKYDYIKYNYNSISNKLYIISIIGMIITGTAFLVFSTYKIYTYIKSRTDKKILHIFIMLMFLIISILFLYFCPWWSGKHGRQRYTSNRITGSECFGGDIDSER